MLTLSMCYNPPVLRFFCCEKNLERFFHNSHFSESPEQREDVMNFLDKRDLLASGLQIKLAKLTWISKCTLKMGRPIALEFLPLLVSSSLRMEQQWLYHDGNRL
jgi:hypothetical protein